MDSSHKEPERESKVMQGFTACNFEDLKRGMEALPNWKDAVMMSILIPYYGINEFDVLSKEGDGKTIAQVLILFGLIEYKPSRRLGISKHGKKFVKWAIDSKILTPYDGADFVVKYGGKFGRRIMYDMVFVPTMCPRVDDDVVAEAAARAGSGGAVKVMAPEPAPAGAATA